MRISSLRTSNISFISIENNRQKFIPKQKNVINYKKHITNDSPVISIFGYKEVEDLYNFAKHNKLENIALKIVPTPLLDCKYVKTQSDLNANKGKWLDITDYDDSVY